MNTYTWAVQALRVLPAEDGLEDVVKMVSATMIGTKPDGHSVNHPMEVYLGPPDPQNFVALADLTDQIVVGWIESNLPTTMLDALKVSLDDRLYEMCDLVETAPPWT